MLVDNFRLATQVLILLTSVVFAFILLPELDLIGGRKDALDVLLIVI